MSRERLLCATPPVGLSGDVHLLLSSDDAVYIDTSLDYTYYLQPTIFYGITPEAGPKRGGTRVTLTGKGLAAFVSELQPLSQQEMTQVIPLIALDYPRFTLDLAVPPAEIHGNPETPEALKPWPVKRRVMLLEKPSCLCPLLRAVVRGDGSRTSLRGHDPR